MLNGTQFRRLQQDTDALGTVARVRLCQFKLSCKPSRQEGFVQRAAVQGLHMGEGEVLLQPCVKCRLGSLTLCSGRQVHDNKLAN